MSIYKFQPILKTVLWGGDKIKSFKNIDTDLDQIGESWEISGVDGNESVVAEGPEAGIPLSVLIDKHRGDLVGDSVYNRFGNKFPLLIKFIDAKADLSVQVHPNDQLALQRHGCKGKTEMWYIIQTDAEAKIYAGLSQETTPDSIKALVAEKKIMDVIAMHKSKVGDVFFLPAGRIHAIGAGNLLAEIQETSDITYRLYDYDRRDAHGNARPLHLEQALGAIDYNVAASYKSNHPIESPEEITLVDCPHFKVDKLPVNGETVLQHSPESFTIAICISGNCRLVADESSVDLPRGHSALISASAKDIRAIGDAILLTACL